MTSRRRPSPPVADRPDPLYRADTAAALLEVSERTLREWRFQGRGPDYVRVEGLIRYRRSAVERYLRDRTVRH